MSIFDRYDAGNSMIDNPLDLNELRKYRIANIKPTKQEVIQSISDDVDREMHKLKSAVRKMIIEDATGKRLEVLKARAYRAYKNVLDGTFQLERLCLPKLKHYTVQTNIELGVEHMIEVMEQEFLKEHQKDESDDSTTH